MIPFYYGFGSGSGSGTVINYGSDFLAHYGSGSASQKVTVPTVPVSVPQRCILPGPSILSESGSIYLVSVVDPDLIHILF